MEKNARQKIQTAQKIVVKIGTSVLTQNTLQLKEAVFDRIAEEISSLSTNSRQFVIVSSGAISAGREHLKLDPKKMTIPQKQAAAAIGQSSLLKLYEKSLGKHGRAIAQLLLTHDDLSDRKRYINAKHTLSTLLAHNIIPIINENDSVVVDEIKVGDNDTLSALITPLIEADLLILLTDIDGLFEKNPKKNPQAKLIPLVHKIDDALEQSATHESGLLGVGGMLTKIQAAKRAVSYGVPTLIANGFEPTILQKILSGENIGTLFLPSQDRLASRKHWIAHTLRPKGKIHVDSGAQKAMVQEGKSLLPSGITQLEGNFEIGDAVTILDSQKKPIAQGLVSYSNQELQKIKGHNTADIEKILGYKYYDEVIHRDDLVVLKKK